MMNDYRALLACYRSGQIPEAAWQDHLRADPLLRLWVARREANRA